MKKEVIIVFLVVCIIFSASEMISVKAYAAEPALNPKGYDMTVNNEQRIDASLFVQPCRQPMHMNWDPYRIEHRYMFMV